MRGIVCATRIGLLLLAILVFMPHKIYAQRSEIGLHAGGAFYLGDLNPNSLFSQTRWVGGVYYRFNIDTRWAFRTGVSYGRLEADDKVKGNPRNLNFKNDIVDIHAMMEINYLNFFIGSPKHNRFTPYLTAGAALCLSNPMGYYTNQTTQTKEWMALHPLHTEGQGLEGGPKQYSLSQFAFPFGLGFRYSISNYVSIGVEWTMRLTFTDYLDDVSGSYYDKYKLLTEYGSMSQYFGNPSELDYLAGAQRGDKGNFDWYSFASITLSVKLGKPKESCPANTSSAISRYRRQNSNF